MKKNSYHVIGVMSGTSLDGVDLVEVNFDYNKSWRFDILQAETVDYDAHWKKKLSELVALPDEVLKKLDFDYTVYLSGIIKDFIKKNKIQHIDAICSHGHTALHQPHKQLTYQIGNQPDLAILIGEKVVCDFRVQDVEMGGQGAPLVPIGDRLLFPEYDFCVNLGGFANVSMEEGNDRIAFDVCPVNIVLNHYVKQLGLYYDDKGSIAASGDLSLELLAALNALEFYTESPPKSLGLEWVKQNVFPVIDAFQLSISDILRTYVEHAAIQIAAVFNLYSEGNVLFSGGGVYHSFLMNRIESLTNKKVVIPSKSVIEFKEALIFGFLGVLKLRNENNCLQSVTGASKNHSSGRIFLP
ncbi:anhydro-N-acetylmuramic acid kinase [Tamlana fucoidanivorans]|uniref:Anhydro-N-acetylmuramic acid kinase n=1 Tax=Allotamlana fucoidanivorans TaxID=2583814 RepID=A0A5C4SJ18_9FLAO|nr:anhydro-N-acetylmuramic acid kinase [Tamlana fucoidanivorans]TNJ43829.1 anhydro-N-acetylmuramic acid kinase [Tamlana fucoidanivorans]